MKPRIEKRDNMGEFRKWVVFWRDTIQYFTTYEEALKYAKELCKP